MNIFEKASREQIRFTTVKGPLTVEHLWDLPLTSRSGFDLDSIAKSTNAELKAMQEESFVVTSTNPAKSTAELKLEVIKFIIADRIAENEKTKQATARKQERERLVEILGQKQDEALKVMTPEEIQKRIAELS
mgnify:FL=1